MMLTSIWNNCSYQFDTSVHISLWIISSHQSNQIKSPASIRIALETLLNEKNWKTDLRKILNSNQDVVGETIL